MDGSTKEDLLKTYIFNKSKKKTIIFIHGLFGNSGFWLPFLPIFKNFKIILLDIDYSKLFENDLKKNNFVTYLDSILKKDEEYVTVAGEALRDDKNFAYVSAWEYTGKPSEAILHKEQLEFKDIELKTRSYK